MSYRNRTKRSAVASLDEKENGATVQVTFGEAVEYSLMGS